MNTPIHSARSIATQFGTTLAPVPAAAHANRGASGFKGAEPIEQDAAQRERGVAQREQAVEPEATTAGLRFLGAGWASDAMALGGFAQYRRKSAAA